MDYGLEDLVKWVREEKGITKIDIHELISYHEEYEQWFSKKKHEDSVSHLKIVSNKVRNRQKKAKRMINAFSGIGLIFGLLGFGYVIYLIMG